MMKLNNDRTLTSDNNHYTDFIPEPQRTELKEMYQKALDMSHGTTVVSVEVTERGPVFHSCPVPEHILLEDFDNTFENDVNALAQAVIDF